MTRSHLSAAPTIVVEYDLVAMMAATGVSAAASLIGVFTVHQGRISGRREDQNTPAIAEAMGTG